MTYIKNQIKIYKIGYIKYNIAFINYKIEYIQYKVNKQNPSDSNNKLVLRSNTLFLKIISK